ncbi:GntR family transcriptional regulator [Paenirhodobacter sp.]|uniref:GntR family transcriptional regulator n=1 Tax=Paenirhodobacter sp. TaxID=1965326 RepID=UPI003B416DC7
MDSASLKIETLPQTLREIATERLRDAILSGLFKSGDRLVERTLCDQLGVSRTVVRESIRYLEAEGLVEFLSNRGPIVARLDWSQARQIYRIRLLLESDAARDCARIADAAVKADLRAALETLRAAYDSGSAHQLFEASAEFYRHIFYAAGHDISWEVVNRLNGRISRLRGMTLSTADRHRAGYARMRRIFDAIDANLPEAAETAVREHIEEASELARQQLLADGDQTA